MDAFRNGMSQQQQQNGAAATRTGVKRIDGLFEYDINTLVHCHNIRLDCGWNALNAFTFEIRLNLIGKKMESDRMCKQTHET